MLTPSQTLQQVNRIVLYLVGISLVDDQNIAFIRDRSEGVQEVVFEGSGISGVALKDRSYGETYRILSESRSYNMRMLDGALVQMMYEFSGRSLLRHRLAFFPSPNLEEFQNHPEIYLEDEVFGDIVAREIVRFPVRFDYDGRRHIRRDVGHPLSHLTLGQYKNCRIPVTSPLTPSWFIDFIVRNFYHTATEKYADGLPKWGVIFAETISSDERDVIHVTVPH